LKSPAIAALLLFALWTAPMPTSAHKASDSYLTLTRTGSDAAAISGRWDIALRDLDNAITLDTNGDGDISWGEVRAKHRSIADYALSRLTVESNGASCSITAGEQLIEQHSDGAYTVLLFTGDCLRPGASLTVDYRLLFDIDPQHRGLLQYVAAGAASSVIFGVDSSRQSIGGAETGPVEQLRQYVRDGVWHIWLGFDHILFLLSLLLPAVLLRRGHAWLPATSFGAVAIDVAKIVTAFTIAHSITLTLDRIRHRALGRARRAQQYFPAGTTRSMDCRVRIRPDSRLRLRQRAQGSRVADRVAGAFAVRFQCRRGARSACHRGAVPAGGFRFARDLGISPGRSHRGIDSHRGGRGRLADRARVQSIAHRFGVRRLNRAPPRRGIAARSKQGPGSGHRHPLQ
jgi:hypothetical protein